jgi:squalene monooxygenase
MENAEDKFDICIIGAGIAGAPIASYLGKSGKKIAIIEFDWGLQERILGELLQPGGYMRLQDLGLGDCIEGIDAVPMTGYALYKQNDEFTIKYPVEGKQITGFGLRNGHFMQNLRSSLDQYANVTKISGRVLDFVEENDQIIGVKYMENESKEEKILNANLTIGCEGPHARLRGKLSKANKVVNGHFVGLKLKDCKLPHEGHGHLVVTDKTPFIIYPISSNEVRLLIDFPGEKPPRLGAKMKELLLDYYLPLFPESTKESFRNAVEEGKFDMFPNHRLVGEPFKKSGAVLLGDSLNMRHPITGGGMSAVFSDVKKLGDQLLRIEDFSNIIDVDEKVKIFYESRHDGTATINILADALYQVLSDQNLAQAMFNYLKKGGAKAEGPIAILGALNKDEEFLKKHFYAVAKQGAKEKLLPIPTPKKIKEGAQMVKKANSIIMPLLKTERIQLN